MSLTSSLTSAYLYLHTHSLGITYKGVPYAGGHTPGHIPVETFPVKATSLLRETKRNNWAGLCVSLYKAFWALFSLGLTSPSDIAGVPDSLWLLLSWKCCHGNVLSCLKLQFLPTFPEIQPLLSIALFLLQLSDNFSRIEKPWFTKRTFDKSCPLFWMQKPTLFCLFCTATKNK